MFHGFRGMVIRKIELRKIFFGIPLLFIRRTNNVYISMIIEKSTGDLLISSITYYIK